MSRATVIAVSSDAARCGHATSAISGSADAQSCTMIGHLNHDCAVARISSSDAQNTWPKSHSAAQAPIVHQKTDCRPRHARRRRARTASGASGASMSAALPTSSRIDG